jgi:hypothetical protein
MEADMATSKRQIADLASRAAFVFVGKVVRTKAALDERLTAPDTAVVEVERVLTAPAMFLSIAGQQITVRVGKNVNLSKGERRTFFANGWIFGATLAVEAVGSVEETDPELLTSTLAATRGASRDEAVKARLDSSVLGVVGTVTSVASSEKRPEMISEHDPNWHEATIQVDEVIKGKATVREAKVLFPNTDDARWRGVAKYSKGQQGIFILQRAKHQDTSGIPAGLLRDVPAGPEVLTTLHHDDYLPLSELDRVRALAEPTREPLRTGRPVDHRRPVDR